MFSTARSSRAASVSNEVEARANQQERRGGTSSRTQGGSHSMVDIMVFGGVVNLSGNMYQATPTALGSSRRNRAMPAEYPRVGRSGEFVNGGPMRSGNRTIFRRDSIRTSNAFTRQPSRHRSSRASRRFDRNSSLQNVEYRRVVESLRFNGTQNTPNVPHMAPITAKTPHLQQHLLPLVPPGSGGVASESRPHVGQDAASRFDAERSSVRNQEPLNPDDNELSPIPIAPGSSRRNSAMPAERRVNENWRDNGLQNTPIVAPTAPFNPRTSPPVFVFPPANTGIGGTASESGHHVEQDATSRDDAERNSVRNQGPLNLDYVDFGLSPIPIERYERQVNENWRGNGLQNTPIVAATVPFNPRTSPPVFVFPPANTGIGGAASESGHHVEQDATSRDDAERNSVRNQGPLNLDDVDFGLSPILNERDERRVNESGRINGIQKTPIVSPTTPINPRTSSPFFVIGGLASERRSHVKQDATSRSNAGRNSVRNQGPLNLDYVDFGLSPILNERDDVVDQKFRFVVVNTSCDSIEDQNEATDLASRLKWTIRPERLIDMPIGNKKMLIVEADKKDEKRIRNHLELGRNWATFWCREALLRGESFLWTHVSEDDLMAWIVLTDWYKNNEPRTGIRALKKKKNCIFTLEKCCRNRVTFPLLHQSFNAKGRDMIRDLSESLAEKLDKKDDEDAIN